MGFGRKTGISLLLPTQNSEMTVELCVRSFVEFADEIIVVDNGSTDSTKDIVRQLEVEIPKLQFYDVPHLPDLHQNRQYALEKSRYSWIARFDSDYVAYTSGPRDVRLLRELVLKTKKQILPIRKQILFPIAYGITRVNLYYDFWHTGDPEAAKPTDDLFYWVPPPVDTLPARIVPYFPGMKFVRDGKFEKVSFQRYLDHVKITEPYWFHCSFKKDRDLLLRSERHDWRGLGKFEMYPTLESYVQSIIGDKYGTNDMDEAARIFIERRIKPNLIEYNPERYYPYPDLIANVMRRPMTRTFDPESRSL